MVHSTLLKLLSFNTFQWLIGKIIGVPIATGVDNIICINPTKVCFRSDSGNQKGATDSHNDKVVGQSRTSGSFVCRGPLVQTPVRI